MDLFDLARSVIDVGLWLVSFGMAGVVAFGVWRWPRWGDPEARVGGAAAAFIVVLVLMAGLMRPALEHAGQPSHPRQVEPNPSSQYG